MAVKLSCVQVSPTRDCTWAALGRGMGALQPLTVVVQQPPLPFQLFQRLSFPYLKREKKKTNHLCFSFSNAGKEGRTGPPFPSLLIELRVLLLHLSPALSWPGHYGHLPSPFKFRVGGLDATQHLPLSTSSEEPAPTFAWAPQAWPRDRQRE